MAARRMHAGLALVLCNLVHPGAEAIANERDWQSAVVIDIVSPERQHAGEPNSPAPPATTHQRSPYPVYTAPGGITRWVFVLETDGAKFVVSTQAIPRNSPLRKLQQGETVETARQRGRTVYLRTKGGKEEKLRLLPDAIVEPPQR